MRNLLLFLLLLTALQPAWSEDLSYDEYMQRIGAGQRKIDHSEDLIKNKELHRLILERDNQAKTKQNPSTTEKFWHEQPKGRADNYQVDTVKDKQANDVSRGNPKEAEHAALATANARLKALEAELARVKSTPLALASPSVHPPKAAKSTRQNGEVKYVYVPPSLRGSTASVSNSRQMKVPTKSIHFGISIGTRIPVRLNTSATNVQPGYIQFLVEKDIVGDKKRLPKGSTIFCQADAVLGSPRLFTSAVKGITKGKHLEFSLRGSIFAKDGKAGLLATVINDGRGLARAKDAGMKVLGAGLMDMIPGTDLTTQAGKAAAALVIEENSEENSANHGRPNYVLDAEPQLAVLQIEETF